MIFLKDYIYEGHTVPHIVYTYGNDIRKTALEEKNKVDQAYSSFLLGYLEYLEHNQFIHKQSKKLHKLFVYMEDKYPFLSFTFKGRIKSFLRLVEKYNAYITQYIVDYHKEIGNYPSGKKINKYLERFSDIIAHRVVIDFPKCNLKPYETKEDMEIKYLYRLCNELPDFLQKLDFDILPAKNLENIKNLESQKVSENLDPYIQELVKDYVINPKDSGYQALHLCLYDITSRCNIEIQLRTKKMDDFAEIGQADHKSYEKKQAEQRANRESIPIGECKYFDDAYERIQEIQSLDLTKVDVNMFTAYENNLINDQAGFLRGRSIQPLEHLSRFQSY